VLFKAEAITAPEEIVRYLGTDEYEGKECDMAYNATLMSHLWHALASENVELLRTALTNLPQAPETATWLNYVRSHDDIGWGLDDADVRAVGQNPSDTRRFCARFYAGKDADSYAEGYHFQVDEENAEARTSGTTAALTGLQKALVEGDDPDVDRALQRTLLMHNVTFAARGMPLLYSGDEIGQFNDYSYLADEEKAQDNRWVHRPPMNWERAQLRHEDGRIEQRLFDEIKRFASTRKTLSALHGRGRERILQGDNNHVLLLERVHDEEHLLVASNFSGTPQAVSLSTLAPVWQGIAFTDVLHDRPAVFSSGRFVLPPYGYLWLQPDEEAAPGSPVTTPIEVEVHTEWGEQVYLCGNLEQLGAGDPRYACGPLSPDDYPVWRTDIEVPAGTYFEFRWIKKRDDRVVEWSPHAYAAKAGATDIWRLKHE
jgi:amylosucrase